MRRLLTALAIACTAAAGCGGDDDNGTEEQVRKAVRDYLTALAAGNGERACATLTAEAQEQAVDVVTAPFADSPELTCGEAIRELSADLAPADERVLLNPEVGNVRVNGDRATAEVEKLTRTVPLQRVDDRWRVAQGAFELER